MTNVFGLATYRYSVLLYKELEKNSKDLQTKELVEYGYPAEENTSVKVFIGTVKNCATVAGISVTNTSHTTTLLTAMQCMTKLRGGGPNHNSIYILHYEPTEEAFKQYRETLGVVNRRIAPSKYDMLINDLERSRQEIKDLQARVARLEDVQQRG
jgi:hypothetical protein